jgi:hypothetical protein
MRWKLATAAVRAHLKPAPHVLNLMAGWKAQGKGLRETRTQPAKYPHPARHAMVRLHRPGAASGRLMSAVTLASNLEHFYAADRTELNDSIYPDTLSDVP